MTVSYKDTHGDTQSITIDYTIYNLTWTCTSNSEGTVTYSQKVGMVSSVSYPDGSAYGFTYGSSGGLKTMTLPTGGTITYTGSGGLEDAYCNTLPSQLTRATSDGATKYTRSYTPGSLSSTTQVSKPDTSSESISFTEPSGSTNQIIGWFETAHSWSNSSGTVLRSTSTCYNGASGNCTGTVFSGPFSEIATTTTLDNSPASKTATFLNTSGLPTEVDEYDFGASTPIRKTIVSYASLGNNITSRPSSVTVEYGSGNVQVSQKTYSYDDFSLASSTATGLAAVSGSRGNQTTEKDWVNTTGATLYSYWCYDTAGQLVASQDPAASAHGQSCSGATSTTYGHDPSDTYVMSVTPPTPNSGIVLPSSTTYDLQYTGLPLSAKDPNNNSVTYNTYNSMLQPTEITYPDGGSSQYTWDNPHDSSYAGLDLIQAQSSSSNTSKSFQQDGYGRTSRQAVANGQSTNPWYLQDTCYNSMGLVGFKSYAYQGSSATVTKVCSGSGDTYSYDSLGRIKTITHADSTSISYTYTGRATQVTDENGVSRITQSDASGRVTSVCEISSSTLQGVVPGPCGQDIAATGFLTSYAYTTDSSKNLLTTITQGLQTRVLTTDSLGRTVSVSEPERGITSYSYTYSTVAGLGMTVTRTRPEANQTNSTVLTTTTTLYDILGRAVRVTYGDGLTPSKQFDYDTVVTAKGWSETTTNLKGLLADTATGSGTNLPTRTLFSYDAMGRALTMWECAPSICGTTYQAARPALGFTYDWTGNLTGEFDGASGLIGYTRSPAGEVTGIQQESYQGTTGNPANVVLSVVNGPNGPRSYSLGNGLDASFSYDSLGRPNGKWLCSGSTQTYCTGGTQIYGNTWGIKGSQIQQESDTVLNQQMNFGYDQFNRLTSRNVYSGAVQNFTYSYDRYGNRWSQTLTAGSGPTFNQSFVATTNQITAGNGYIYDAAGNMTNDSTHSYTYDAEGNIVAVDGGATAQYVYDALNRRVSAQANGFTFEYMYDYANRRTSSWIINYFPNTPAGFGFEGRIYWDGRQIAFRSGDGQTYFDHQDWLGTERIRTNYQGTTAATYTSLPFGDAFSSTVNDSWSDWLESLHFAGLDFDSESNTSHAQFRNYSSAQGRWLAPDPYDGSYDLTNPQSFNRYTYALNNPLSFKDPSGLDCQEGEGGIGTETCNAPPPGCENGCYDQYGNWYTPNASQIQGGQTSVDAGDAWDADGGYIPTENGTGGWYGISGASYGGMNFGGGSSGGGTAPNNPTQPAPKPEKEPYWKCVGKTTFEDAAWGAAGTAAVAVVVPTVAFAVAGSSIGPEGTVAGGGLGFAVGVALAPGAAVDSLVLGVPVGLFHGLVGCAF